MISKKVLITLAVIVIKSCRGNDSIECEECEEYDKCEESDKCKKCNVILTKVGFSEVCGFMNYCFTMQFQDYEKLDDHIKEKYKVEELKDLVKQFFEYNKNIKAEVKLELRDICLNYTCEKKIISTFDGTYVRDDKEDEDEIVEISKIENSVEKIEYGKNKFKNIIKSYNLNIDGKSKIEAIKEFWKAEKIYYWDCQVSFIKEMKENDMFLTTTKWCLKQIEDAAANTLSTSQVT